VRTSRLIGLLLAGLAACRQEQRLDLDVQPGDLVAMIRYWVQTGSDHSMVGEALSAELIRIEKDAQLSAPADPGSFMFAAIRPSEYVGPDGQPLPADFWSGAVLRVGAAAGPPPTAPVATPGSCGRCLAPSPSAPQVVYPGDSCPLARFARSTVWTSSAGVTATVTPAILDEVRGAVRIEWPGACPCLARPDPMMAPPHRTYKPVVVDAGDPGPVPSVFAATGTIALLNGSNLHLLATTSSGAAKDLTIPLDPNTSILTAAALNDAGRRWVYAIKGSSMHGSNMVVAGSSMIDLQIQDASERKLLPQVIAPLPGGQIFLAGGTRSDEFGTVLALCGVTGVGVPCVYPKLIADLSAVRDLGVTMILPAIRGADGSTVSAAIVAQGGLIYYQNLASLTPADVGNVTFQPEQDAPWRGTFGAPSDMSRRYAIRGYGFSTEFPWSQVRAAAADAGRIYLCVEDLGRAAYPDLHVFTASVGPWLFTHTSTSDFQPWKEEACVPFSRCAGFTQLSRGVRLGVLGGGSLDFADGRRLTGTGTSALGARCEVVPDSDGYPGLDRPLVQAFSGGRGVTLAESADRALYVADAAAADASFHRVFGRDADVRTRIGAILPQGSSFWAFGENRLLRFDTDSRALQTGNLAGFAPGDVVEGGALDTASGSMLVFGECRSASVAACPFIRQVSSDQTVQAVAEADLSAAQVSALIGLAELLPGQHIAASRSGLFRLSGGHLSAIDVAWDDPFTADVETEPTGDPHCFDGIVPGGIAQRQDHFHGLGAGFGVAWAVGCNGTVVRIDALGAVAVARSRLPKDPNAMKDDPEFADYTLTSAAAFCPDEVVFGGALIDAGKGRIVTGLAEMQPDYDASGMARAKVSGPPEDAGHPFSILDYPINAAGWTRLVFGDATRFSLILTDPDGWSRSRIVDAPDYGERFSWRETLLSAGSSAHGVLLGSAYGRLIYGSDAQP
jgi:hypothetical protein